MRIRNKWVEIEWSKYTFWHIKYSVPSDANDSWNWTRRNGKAIYRSWLSIGIWHLYFRLYLWSVTPFEHDWGLDDSKQYGMTYFERSIHLHWGNTYVYWMPWQWDCVRHDLLLPNGDLYYRNKYPLKCGLGERKRTFSWYDVLDANDSPYPHSPVQTQVAQYVDLTHYTKDGEKQVAHIRLAGEEREWRWLWFRWLPWPSIKRRVVDCMSDVELGEKAGSWKGGMLGWSADWKQGETMEQAFWRWYKEWDGK